MARVHTRFIMSTQPPTTLLYALSSLLPPLFQGAGILFSSRRHLKCFKCTYYYDLLVFEGMYVCVYGIFHKFYLCNNFYVPRLKWLSGKWKEKFMIALY